MGSTIIASVGGDQVETSLSVLLHEICGVMGRESGGIPRNGERRLRLERVEVSGLTPRRLSMWHGYGRATGRALRG